MTNPMIRHANGAAAPGGTTTTGSPIKSDKAPEGLETTCKSMLLRLLAVIPGIVLSAVASISAAQGQPCGGDQLCEIDGGSYHLSVPDGWDGTSPLPAIVFFHGHRSSGKSALRGSVNAAFGKAGYAIIAPNGPVREGADYRYWPARPMQNPPRDNIAFTERVMADAVGPVADRSRPDRRWRVLGRRVDGMDGCVLPGWHLRRVCLHRRCLAPPDTAGRVSRRAGQHAPYSRFRGQTGAAGRTPDRQLASG